MHGRFCHPLQILGWLVLGWGIPGHANVLEVQRPIAFKAGVGSADTRTQKIILTNQASEPGSELVLLEAFIKPASLVSSQSEPMFSIESPQPKEFPIVIQPGEARSMTIKYNNIYELSPSVDDERLILVGYAKNNQLPEFHDIPLLGLNPTGPQLSCNFSSLVRWEHPTVPSMHPIVFTCTNEGDELLRLSSIHFESNNIPFSLKMSPQGEREIPPKKSISFVVQSSVGPETPEGSYHGSIVMQTNENFKGLDPKDATSSLDVSVHVVRSPAVIEPVQWDMGSVDPKDAPSKTFTITMVGGYKLLGWEATFEGADAALFSIEPASYEHTPKDGKTPSLKVVFHPQEKQRGKDIEARLRIRYHYEAKGKKGQSEFLIDSFLGRVITQGEPRAQKQEKVVFHSLSPGSSDKITLPFSLGPYGFSPDVDVPTDRRWIDLRLEGADASLFQAETFLQEGRRPGLAVSVRVPPNAAERIYKATLVAKAALTMRATHTVTEVLASWPLEVTVTPSTNQQETSP